MAPGYSAVDDPISGLAAVNADTRPLMTAGFIAFGVGVPLFAVTARAGLGWMTAVATGVATLAVAALPLDRSASVDTWHGVAATIGYVTLAATPVLSARRLRGCGCRHLARFGVICSAVAATALALTTTGLPTGLFQRIGLTAGDVWIMAAAVAAQRGLRP